MIIIIPDYQGRELGGRGDPGNIFARIPQIYPEATVVPVLNGGESTALERQARANRTERLSPIVSKDCIRGLLGSIISGFEYALSHGPDQMIVRLDTAEHDPSYIGTMASLAERIGGMVIGELDFTNGHLVAGSYDHWTHTDVFPTVYSGMTNGRLRLSCAHGFQAFAPGSLAEPLKRAREIVAKVEEESGKPQGWGFDAAMAIGALASGIPIELFRVPAESDRNRPIEKINGQLTQHLMLLKAALKLGMV